MEYLALIQILVLSHVVLAQQGGATTGQSNPSVVLLVSRPVMNECEPVWLEYRLQNQSAAVLEQVRITSPAIDIEKLDGARWTRVQIGSSPNTGACTVAPGGEARGCLRLARVVCALLPGDYRVSVGLGRMGYGPSEWRSGWCNLRVTPHAGNRQLAASPNGSQLAVAWSMFQSRSLLDGWIDEAPLTQQGMRMTVTLTEYEQTLQTLNAAQLSTNLARQLRIEWISLLWARAKRGGPGSVTIATQGLTEVAALEGVLQAEAGAVGAYADLMRLKVELVKIALPGQAAIAEQALQTQVPGVRLLTYARSR